MALDSSKKSVIAIVAVLAALGAAAYAYKHSGDAEVDPDAKYKVSCSKCGTEFDMSASEYLAKAPQGTDVSGAFTCPKCGADKAVTKVAVQPKVSNPTSPEDLEKWKSEALTLDDIRKERAANGGVAETTPEGKPKVPPRKVAD